MELFCFVVVLSRLVCFYFVSKMTLDPIPHTKETCNGKIDSGTATKGLNTRFRCENEHIFLPSSLQGYPTNLDLLGNKKSVCCECGGVGVVHDWFWGGICRVSFEFASLESDVKEVKDFFFEGFDGWSDCKDGWPENEVIWYQIMADCLEEFALLKVSVVSWTRKMVEEEEKKREEIEKSVAGVIGECVGERESLSDTKKEVEEKVKKVKKENKERKKKKMELEKEVVKGNEKIRATPVVMKEIQEKMKGDIVEQRQAQAKLDSQV